MDIEDRKVLARKVSDKSRKVLAEENHFLVPHKFTPEGELLNENNLDYKRDISRLNLKDLQFLILWRGNDWNNEKTLQESGLEPDQAEKTFKKLAYFRNEDARVKALASTASPERIIAKDMENLETSALTDSQHKSLDRLGKILGAFKPSSEINIQQNIFNTPKISPEAWDALKQIAEREADVIEVKPSA